MKIKVKVITNSSQERVEYRESENIYKIWTHTKPIKGEATKRARALLAEYLHLSKHLVVLVSGKTSRIKTFEIKKDIDKT